MRGANQKSRQSDNEHNVQNEDNPHMCQIKGNPERDPNLPHVTRAPPPSCDMVIKSFFTTCKLHRPRRKQILCHVSDMSCTG